MRITITTSDSEDPEVYDSLEELAEELDESASGEYAATVLSRINGGEKHFMVANGTDLDTYDIEDTAAEALDALTADLERDRLGGQG
jgi:hypothetical protein